MRKVETRFRRALVSGNAQAIEPVANNCHDGSFFDTVGGVKVFDLTISSDGAREKNAFEKRKVQAPRT